MSRRTLILIAMTALALAAIAIYYYFDPTEHVWMPQCPSKLFTGYDCPACGSQRMLHAALHGDFLGAFRFNPFIVISLPYAAMVIWSSFAALPGSLRLRTLTHSPIAAWTYVICFFVWWILRNVICPPA